MTANTSTQALPALPTGGIESSFKTRQLRQRESVACPKPRHVGPCSPKGQQRLPTNAFGGRHAVITAIRGAAASQPGASLSPASSGSRAGAQRPTQPLEKQSAAPPWAGAWNGRTPPVPGPGPASPGEDSLVHSSRWPRRSSASDRHSQELLDGAGL